MARTKSDAMPDLSNATPSFLIDEIGTQRVIKTAAEKLEKFYKTALYARMGDDETTVEGEKFAGLIEEVNAKRFNKDKAIALLTELGATPEQIADCHMSSSYNKLTTSALRNGND